MIRKLLTLAVPVGLALAGCAGASGTGETSSPTPPVSSAPSAGVSQDAVYPSQESSRADLSTLDPDRSQACGIATRAVKLYARPWLGEETWLAELRPYASAQFWADLQGTDPARIPAKAVTTDGFLVTGEATNSDRLVTCEVPTDVGPYRVLLSRSPEQPDWRVERIQSVERRAS